MKMMNKVLATVGLVVALGTATVVTTRKNEAPVNAATVQTERRIYAVAEANWGTTMYAHYWGDASAPSTTFETAVPMTRTLSDYYNGLFFIDLPMDVTHVLFRQTTGAFTKQSDQSADLAIIDLFNTGYKVAKVGGWVNDGTSRIVTVDTAPMSSDQFAWGVFAWIDSCSTSYASGYNSYMQVRDVFYKVSTIDGTTTFDEQVGGHATGLSIDTKMAMLLANFLEERENMGNLNPLALPTTVDKGLIIFVGIGLLSLTGFFIFKKTRKNIA